MMVLNGSVTIEINIEKNGVYMLQRECGVGKTYLATLVKDLISFYPECAVVTYSGDRMVVYGNLSTAKFIVMDRFDRYALEISGDQMKDLGKRAIVLIASKCYYNTDFGFSDADVEIVSESLVTVTNW